MYLNILNVQYLIYFMLIMIVYHINLNLELILMIIFIYNILLIYYLMIVFRSRCEGISFIVRLCLGLLKDLK
jgi:hypothetical protein